MVVEKKMMELVVMAEYISICPDAAPIPRAI